MGKMKEKLIKCSVFREEILRYDLATSDRDNDLSSGELAPGGTITGAIPFEQPINDSELTLIYEGDFWSSDEIKFTLQ